jgi:glycogen synthase
MTTDTLGGVFSYAVELLHGLAARGAETVLATMGRALSAGQRAQLQDIPNLEVHESEWALEWMDEPWADVRACGEWLEQLARQVAPDCIHLNHFAHGALDWPAPVVVVGHSCVPSWWRAVHGSQAPATWSTYRRTVRAGLRAADLVVAPTRAMQASLIEHYGPLAHSCVVPNGIDLSCYAPHTKQPFVLAAGRLWDPAKNIAALQGLAKVLTWPVCVAGELSGPNEAAREYNACRQLGMLSRRELADWMGRASIYALPARYEPFGLSVLEAAASGCALVLGRVPSLLENWSGAACFVEPDDRDELQRALTGLIADRARRKLLGARAQQRAQSFGAGRMADAYMRIYTQLSAAAQSGVMPCAS